MKRMLILMKRVRVLGKRPTLDFFNIRADGVRNDLLQVGIFFHKFW